MWEEKTEVEVVGGSVVVVSAEAREHLSTRERHVQRLGMKTTFFFFTILSQNGTNPLSAVKSHAQTGMERPKVAQEAALILA